MMNGSVVYIEDQQESIDTFTTSLKRIYGDEYDVVSVLPEPLIGDMLSFLAKMPNVASYVIDERLSFTGVANYSGSELSDAIRDIDPKIPVYILTSYATDVDHLDGAIEFVIDKNDLVTRASRSKIAQRMLRHLGTFREIKSRRAERLDELLKKSLNHGLSKGEKEEYNQLNFMRIKPVLYNEVAPSQEQKDELDEQERILYAIKKSLGEL